MVSINIFSDVKSLLQQGSPVNAEGNFIFSSNNITAGVDGRNLTVATSGSVAGGAIVFTGIDDASTGVLSLAGTVTVDTTLNSLVGANINLVASETGVGTIRSTGTGNTILTVSAGGGDIQVGNLSADNQINTFTVSTGNEISLNDLFVAGNTVDVKVTGNIDANGVIQDSVGDVGLLTTTGNISLTENLSSSGSLKLTADGGMLTTKGVP